MMGLQRRAGELVRRRANRAKFGKSSPRLLRTHLSSHLKRLLMIHTYKRIILEEFLYFWIFLVYEVCIRPCSIFSSSGTYLVSCYFT